MLYPDVPSCRNRVGTEHPTLFRLRIIVFFLAFKGYVFDVISQLIYGIQICHVIALMLALWLIELTM